MYQRASQQEKSDPLHTRGGKVCTPRCSSTGSVHTSEVVENQRHPGLYLVLDQVSKSNRRIDFVLYCLYGNNGVILNDVFDLYNTCERQRKMDGICSENRERLYYHKVTVIGKYLLASLHSVTGDLEQSLNKMDVSILPAKKTFTMDEIKKFKEARDENMQATFSRNDLPCMPFTINLSHSQIRDPQVDFKLQVSQLDESQNVINGTECNIEFAALFESAIEENQPEAIRGFRLEVHSRTIKEKLTGIADIISYLVDQQVLSSNDKNNLDGYNIEDIDQKHLFINEFLKILSNRENSVEQFILALTLFGDDNNRDLAAHLRVQSNHNRTI